MSQRREWECCCANLKLLGMDREPGAFAQYVAVNAQNVFPIADAMSDMQAVTAEPLAVAVHSFALIEPKTRANESLAIYGMGTQGMLALLLARTRGFGEIIAVDPKPKRLELARQLGATHVVNARGAKALEQILEWTLKLRSGFWNGTRSASSRGRGHSRWQKARRPSISCWASPRKR